MLLNFISLEEIHNKKYIVDSIVDRLNADFIKFNEMKQFTRTKI